MDGYQLAKCAMKKEDESGFVPDGLLLISSKHVIGQIRKFPAEFADQFLFIFVPNGILTNHMKCGHESTANYVEDSLLFLSQSSKGLLVMLKGISKMSTESILWWNLSCLAHIEQV